MPPASSRLISLVLATLLAGIWTASSSITARAGLDECYDAYKELAAKPKARAMAVTTAKNTCWWQWGSASKKQAEREVLAACQKEANDCRLLDAEQDIALLKKQEKEEREKKEAMIREVQIKLKEMGLYTGNIDGRRGPETNAAIRNAQQQFNLSDVDDDLLAQILNGSVFERTEVKAVQEIKDVTMAPKFRARHILLASESEANTALERLNNGEKFEYLAKELSLDGSKDYGGDLGYFTANEMVDEFSSAVEDMAVGETSKPVRTDFGWHVIRLEDRTTPTSQGRLTNNSIVPQAKIYISALTDTYICRGAYNVNRADWETLTEFAGHVSEARRRGLSAADCRVVIGLEPLRGQPEQSKEKSDWVICMSALVANREAFATGDAYSSEVAEAKRRGLSVNDCRAALGLDNKKLIASTDAIRQRPNEAICASALIPTRTRFSPLSAYQPEVKEATRRGLSVDDCRVVLRLSRLSTMANNETSKNLCSMALNSTRLGWETGSMYSPQIEKVKQRGLSLDDCRELLGFIRIAEHPPLLEKGVSSLSNRWLSIKEICRQSLNTDQTDWSSASSTTEARSQADALGITVDVCRLTLGLKADQTSASNDITPTPTAEPDAIADRRVALVVGIDDYENLPQLKKAVNDSRAVAETLTRIGYDVVSVENPDRRTLNRKLSELQGKIQPGDNALFYFAGHGVALGGENILIAKDMPEPASGDEDLVRSEGFSVDDIVRRIQKQGAKTAFLVLDACRDNPFEATGTRSIGTTRGLAKTDTPSGVFVLFSAGIGQAALDRLSDTDSDPNSVFTRKLLPALAAPSVTHIDLAKKVQKEVAELASTINHQQQPAYYDQIIGEVVINPQ